MGKRSAVVELFLGDIGSMQRELRPSTQREDQLTMETKLEQIAVKAVNQLPKSVVREIRTPRSVGAGGGRPPPATRWARGNSRPYRDRRVYAEVPQEVAVRENKAAVRSGASRSGAAEGVPDRGRPSDAGSRSYVDIDTSQIFGGADHRYMKGKSSIWIAQNVERKMRNFLGHKFWLADTL